VVSLDLELLPKVWERESRLTKDLPTLLEPACICCIHDVDDSVTFLVVLGPDGSDVSLASQVPELEDCRRKRDLADWKRREEGQMVSSDEEGGGGKVGKLTSLTDSWSDFGHVWRWSIGVVLMLGTDGRVSIYSTREERRKEELTLICSSKVVFPALSSPMMITLKVSFRVR